MNYKSIKYLLGWIIKVEGIFMILPFFVSLYYKETSGFIFLICSLFAIGSGFLMTRKKPARSSFYAREGFVTTALGWIVMSFVGCLPFYLSGQIPNFIDAMFEIISGFTTTGASILDNVEDLSRSMQLWRCFSIWIGGMGVLVFMLAVLPLANDGQSMHLMKAESSGPSVSKLLPRLKTTAVVLYVIYVVMTLIQIVLLLLGRMPVFDAVCISFSTAGTGGFAVLNDSLSSYNTYLQFVITIFMMLFGVNFTFYFLIISKRGKEALKIEELRWYFIIYFVFVILITVHLTKDNGDFLESLHNGAFQAASMMTSSGFFIIDINVWPQFPKMLLLLLTFIGACAGSTGGGIKVSRIIICVKMVGKELSYLIHPRSVKVIKVNEKKLEHEVIRSVNTFFIAYIFVFMVSLLLISLNDFDFMTNFTAVTATFNNTGLGFGMLGPSGNFSIFSDFSKVVLMFNMLAGRLEIFPILLLFSSGTFRK